MLLLGVLWYTHATASGPLMKEVDSLTHVSWFESKWLYTGLLLFTASFPLLFGFLPSLKFYKEWPSILLANIPVTIFFILWDIYFTKKGVWGFSERYTTGIRFIGLPIEECLFFVIIPTACIFIYWSLKRLMLKEPFSRIEKPILIVLILFFTIIALLKWNHIYTSTTALLCSFFLLFHLFFVRPGYRGRFFAAYLISCLPFLLVNGVLTGAFTESPVVLYNPDAYFGLRVITVPVDDFGYSFLMLFGNITLFEAIRKKIKSEK
jgi:lycopene cyclase domain-containing protein